MAVTLTVNGQHVELGHAAAGASLLDVLREDLGLRSVKDGCSPQGQCGCCTVLVDGAPRVACVTPLRRVAGRRVDTVEGLDGERRSRLVECFLAAGASQCGFCTPGILCRLAPLPAGVSAAQVEQALLAHLCRCTGWRTVVEAGVAALAPTPAGGSAPGARDLEAAARRATLEGGTPQAVGPDVVAGGGGFADDTAPAGALVAVPAAGGGWSLGDSPATARAGAGKVQGRRSGRGVTWPIDLPAGPWDVTLQTTWVEPAYLEPDASWCLPGGDPATPLANGGAFGGKETSMAPPAARRLADEHRRPVRVLLAREDVVRTGPKRPPLAAGVRADGTGVVRVARTPGIAEAIASVAPGLVVEEVDVAGPPTSVRIRGAGWVEAAVLLAGVAHRAHAGAAHSAGAPSSAGRAHPAGAPSSAGAAHPAGATDSFGAHDPAGGPAAEGATGEATVVSPAGGRASASVTVDAAGRPRALSVTVACGDPLDPIVVRSYAVGAAHMALSWVCSEAIATDDEGVPEDLTIRSFGILRARETPEVRVTIEDEVRPPVNGSDAVFAAVAAAAWIAQSLPGRWPTSR
jgi:xanthine dehydrogenase small subunit